MLDEAMRQNLASANDLEEVKEILKDCPKKNAEQAWKEIQAHHSSKAEKLALLGRVPLGFIRILIIPTVPFINKSIL